jgi:hypothetical protein
MNLSEIWAESGRLLNDPTNTRWTTDVLTIRANMAQTEIQGLTSAVKTTENLTTAATISLNSSTMNVLRAFITWADSSVHPIDQMTIEELMFRYPNYLQWSASTPRLYVYDATAQTVSLYPSPSSDLLISNGFSVVEIRKPSDLSASTDIPFESNNQMVPYHMAIVHWVVAQCWMDDGTPEALAKARFHKSGNMLHPGEYEKQIGRIISEFDATEDIQQQVLWKPEGGRAGGWGFPSKSNPLPW